MSDELQLASLIAKRGAIKRKMTFAKNFILSFKTGDDLKQVQNRIETVKHAYTEFFECQYDIELLETSLNKSSTADQAEQFDKQYNEVLAELQSLIEEDIQNTIAIQKSQESVNTIDSEVGVKLPAVNLPSFDGTYSKWLYFRDTFLALVHENKNLTSIQKFHYLKSCLINDASRVIESLSVSEANYTSAWQGLLKRFDNKRLIVQDLLSSILNAPLVTKNAHLTLRQLSDSCTVNINALKAAGIDTSSWDPILIAVLTEKLDYQSKREWQASLSTEIPKLSEFMNFIEKRCQFLEAMQTSVRVQTHLLNKEANSNNFRPHQSKYANNTQHKIVTNAFKATVKPSPCMMCKGSHALYQCVEFTNLSVSDRLNFVMSNNICENCLKSSHETKNCKSNSFCKLCNRKHNSLLHTKNYSNNNPSSKISNVSSAENEVATTNLCSSSNETLASVSTVHSYTVNVLLPTAMVRVFDDNGCSHLLRVLLDSASQLNFISKKALTKLCLKVWDKKVSVVGINQTVRNIHKATIWKMQSCYSDFQIEVTGFVIDKITENMPQFSCNPNDLNLPEGICLADPKYFESREIDILIGSNIFWELISSGKIYLGPSKPILQETQLGWIISGNVPISKQTKFVCNLTTSLQDQIIKFWDLENYGEKRLLSSDEQQCEVIFNKTHKRTSEGSYLVKLPFKHEPIKLGSTYQIALKRFHALETRFKRDPEYKQEYTKVMQEYLQAGHIEKVPFAEISRKSNVFYLPHHGVIKPDGTTTKLRIVFHASCKSSTGSSLNEYLLVGPKLQQDLFSILTRFRKHKVALTADIEKMFFQIFIDAEHRDFQRFFWRSNENNSIENYRIRKVSFGTASAPYLAVKCLQQLAFDEGHNYPLANPVILRDFYMDDLLTGAESVELALKLKEQLTQCLTKGGFTLRKWAANNSEVLKHQNETIRQQVILLDKDNVLKTLGMMWDYKTDFLFYSIKLETNETTYTKRSILSVIARLYDPMGLINPVLVTAKILLQQIWIKNLNWDDTVPPEIGKVWESFLKDIGNINKIRIPRNVIPINNPQSCEIHAFCDASEKAYGTCIFIRAKNNFEVSVRLLCAKSRVAPVKRIALPRLELCGALLLSRLLKSVMNTIELYNVEVFCWTDSTIVLNWLRIPPNNLETFVGNRIAEIQNNPYASKWRHIPSHLNPADVLSRGCSAATLIENDLWNNGPDFLKFSIDTWPQMEINLNHILTNEQNTLFNCQKTTVYESWETLNKFSNFSKLIRVIAYCQRFINLCKKICDSKGMLKSTELQTATRTVIMQIQRTHFHDEVRSLQKGKSIPKTSKLLNLYPFIDSDGLLRVGGRLANSSLPYKIKYPLILPKNDYVTQLLIMETHIKQLHAGPQATLAALRQKYWILCGRSVVRLVIHKCVKCFKVKPISCTELMGNLPKQRVDVSSRAFQNSAIDYTGPISIKGSKGRGRNMIKGYIALFICLATRAIHLELVTDCTSESFVNTLKRFMARRGKPSTIMSDNATTFKGADHDIKKAIHSAKARRFIEDLSVDGIQWTFIPPRSPHFGGIYEAGIKSVKYHLKRVVGQALLTYEEMNTVLTQIEACLNSRPITPMSDSPDDFEVLTPGHFLIGEALTATPEPDIHDIPENRLSRWQRVERIRQHFWKRWSREFVVQLQQRQKWKMLSDRQLQVGNLVVIQEDHLPPLQWAMGRIEQLHPGRDGLIRVVSVKTKCGVIKRAINRLCVLPISDNGNHE